MSMMEAVKSAFSNYANFSGRARRSEYWYFVLFNFLVSTALGVLAQRGGSIFTALGSLYSLAVLVPGWAVACRRLHDTGRSGLYLLLPLVPMLVMIGSSAMVVVQSIVGGGSAGDISMGLAGVILVSTLASLVLGIVMLIWLCKDSQVGPNRYGPDPKAPPEEPPFAYAGTEQKEPWQN